CGGWGAVRRGGVRTLAEIQAPAAAYHPWRRRSDHGAGSAPSRPRRLHGLPLAAIRRAAPVPAGARAVLEPAPGAGLGDIAACAWHAGPNPPRDVLERVDRARPRRPAGLRRAGRGRPAAPAGLVHALHGRLAVPEHGRPHPAPTGPTQLGRAGVAGCNPGLSAARAMVAPLAGARSADRRRRLYAAGRSDNLFLIRRLGGMRRTARTPHRPRPASQRPAPAGSRL